MALPFFGIGMKVRNRFKGLDLIDRVPDEPWIEVCTGHRDQDHHQEKEMQKKKKERNAEYIMQNAGLC